MRKTAFPDIMNVTRHNYGYSYSGIDLMAFADANVLAGGVIVEGTMAFDATAMDGGAAAFPTAATDTESAGIMLPRIFDQAANRCGSFDILLKWTEAATDDASVCFGVADVDALDETEVAFAADGIIGTTHDGVFIYKQEGALVWRAACVTGGVKTDKILKVPSASGGLQWLQIETNNDSAGGTASIRIDNTGGPNFMPTREAGTSARNADVFFTYALDTEMYRPFALVRAGASPAAETIYIGQVNAWQNRL